ncbi:asparagine synthase (glutamine-hydrolysing) [Arsukibacterium tuosuense]|uniref:asparagine synthase (glutamine-hydrolyzing) n=1 Tax=Arsukibacterium tuosuense TaxID=1323745 RepID=A0A285IUI4_9GAMM|nr:asparagine synthase-related protein [Arsukibacterium tuosuense]SNY51642.1 asparagine synthase (glutamine-hydrolysing) [Arsukibacterium tuosuense]
MWCQNGISTYNPDNDKDATLVKFNLKNKIPGFPEEVELSSFSKIDVAENENSLVCISGRLRPYDQDYMSGNAAQWFLDLYQREPTDFCSHIAGFFLLIILDKTAGTVRIVNDHVGSIPCYIDQRKKTELRISNNMASLQVGAANTELNPQAIFNYLFFHCIPSPHSIYKGISKLEPGVIASFDRSGMLTQQRYYNPAFTGTEQTSEQDEQQLMAKCRDLISEAVRRNISDDCAAFLSGGLDSSTVAGMLAKHNKANGRKAITYSVGFEAKGYDETEYALLTARHFNTEHKVHYLQPEEIASHFTEVAGYFNEPFGNSSAMAAYICAKVAQQDGIKVLLAGDGGDEIFAGNERYFKQKVFERYNALPSPLQALLNLALDNPVADKMPGVKKASSYVRQAKVPLPDRLDSYNFVNRFDLRQMFSPEILQQVDANLPAQQKRERYNACSADNAVDKMMYLDWKFTLADNDLVKVNQMCQLAGVEVRFPLFEKEVVDFSCTVPASLKAPGQKLRDFYKNSFRGFLPDETLSKSKHGFGLPFGVWMKQRPDLQHIALDAMQSFKQRNILQPSFVDQAIDTFEKGHSGYYGELVWIIVVLELWLQQHGANNDT